MPAFANDSVLPESASRGCFESAVENSADGILVIDNSFNILVFNPKMERLTGWEKEKIIGRKCYEVLHPRDIHGTEICQTRCPMFGKAEGISYFRGTITAREGKPVDAGISYSIVSSPDSELTAVVNIRDITGLAELDELRTALLAGVSHELQTPISIIKAYASTLARSDVSWSQETMREKLKAIEEESDTLSAIVGKLLYTSHLDAGSITLNRFVLDLKKEVKRTTTRFNELTDSHRIEADFPPDWPLVLADPEKIDEILINLIENAIKFSPDGGTIKISGNITDNHVLISVEDEGIGILNEDGERLFERFFRGEASSALSSRGTGLGLHICRSLIEAHGGRITVEGQPGKGTCFTFSLPISRES